MIVNVRINITDIAALHAAAMESFLKMTARTDDDMLNAIDRLGTADFPKVTECAIELVADTDHGGLFEFMD